MSVGVNSTGQPGPVSGVSARPVGPTGPVGPAGPIKEITIEVATVHWDKIGTFSETKGYSIRYKAAEHQGGDFLDVDLPGRIVKIPAVEIIKVARDMQAKQRQQPEDTIDVDHQNLLNDILKHIEDNDGTVQVLEGDVENVKLEHFSGNTPSSLLELIHFIEVNKLQETRPWCAVWNLYRCMMVAAGRA